MLVVKPLFEATFAVICFCFLIFMRIFQIITLCELGGAQSVVVNLSNSLCKQHEVIVAAGEGDGKMWGLMDASIKQEHLPSLRRALSPIGELKAIAEMRRLYKKYNPDVIHLHSSKVGILGRVAFPKSKVLYTVHGFDSIRIAYRKYLPVEKFLQNRCQAIVGVSKYDERNLESEGITNHVGMVYNGIYPPVKLNVDPFRNIQGYERKVLCIARLSPQKKLDLFLEVAALLPQYASIWIGNQHPVEVEHTSNVFFMGNMPNAGAYNEYADLFLLPTNYEGLPIVIIEALACGKPVVASAVGGISELLDGTNGFAVRNDAKEMAEKINLIFSDADLYERMSKTARQTYFQSFTVDKMVAGYLQIYNQIYQQNVRK